MYTSNLIWQALFVGVIIRSLFSCSSKWLVYLFPLVFSIVIAGIKQQLVVNYVEWNHIERVQENLELSLNLMLMQNCRYPCRYFFIIIVCRFKHMFHVFWKRASYIHYFYEPLKFAGFLKSCFKIKKTDLYILFEMISCIFSFLKFWKSKIMLKGSKINKLVTGMTSWNRVWCWCNFSLMRFRSA